MLFKSFISIEKKLIWPTPTILMIVLALWGCQDKTRTQSQMVEVDSLVMQYKMLNDSIEKSWAYIIAEDDDKHVLMKRLLLEVSYTNNYDKVSFEELTRQVDILHAMRYDQLSMSSSSLIDHYDSATWALADKVAAYARSHPRYQDIPLMEELINEINEKNNLVLLQRIRYDKWVKRRNEFVESNASLLQSREPELSTEPMPLFELPS